MPIDTRWTAVLVLAAGFLLAACSSGSEQPPLACSEPPPNQLAAISPLEMTLEPSPVQAGQSATVIVAAPPSPARPFMGVDLDWLCWDGSEWTMTHKLVTDDLSTGPFIFEHPPPSSGVTTTIPDLPVALPSSSGIVIPDVTPGSYRLQTSRPVGETTVPFVLIEVVS